LRSADGGDLGPLVAFIGELQRSAILEALNLSEEAVHDHGAIQKILATVDATFDRREKDKAVKIERVKKVADSLQLLSHERLEEISKQVATSIGPRGFQSYAAEGRRGDARAQHNYFQIIQCANALGYFANLAEYQAWAKLVIATAIRTELLVAFHGIGKGVTGVIGCVAMIYSKSDDDAKDGERRIGDVVPLTQQPFEFTYSEDPLDVQKRYQQWLDERIVDGMKWWQERV
jgi:hypothetical protein